MTRATALRVPISRGEEERRALQEQGNLRTDLKVRREGEFLLLPLQEGAAPPEGQGGEMMVAEFESFPSSEDPRRYQDLVECPPTIREKLPRSFDVIGDIVLVRIPRGLDSYGPRIGEALLKFVPRSRIVGRDRGVKGVERRRSLERLAGSGGWGTVHRENGVAIHADVELAYFSPRLAREHAWVSDSVQSGEVVYDLCCGVGPFALAIAHAGRASRVVAVDRNPAAIALLGSSLRELKGGPPVETIPADISDFLERAAPADRAILNLPLEGIKYLPSVARRVRPVGRIHYYEVVSRDAVAHRTEEIVRDLGGASRWAVADVHVVHPYSPSSDLTSFTFAQRTGESG